MLSVPSVPPVIAFQSGRAEGTEHPAFADSAKPSHLSHGNPLNLPLTPSRDDPCDVACPAGPCDTAPAVARLVASANASLTRPPARRISRPGRSLPSPEGAAPAVPACDPSPRVAGYVASVASGATRRVSGPLQDGRSTAKAVS